MKDQKLTEILFASLKGEAKLFKEEEWVKAGDFACEMRFFPHAFQCYQRANELKKSELTLQKINTTLDKITNVLEDIPEKLKSQVEEIRLSNPLDPAKWLGITNLILKEYSDELAQENLSDDTEDAAKFALAFAIYCAKRTGSPIEEMNKVLIDLDVQEMLVNTEKKLDLVKLADSKNDEPIKVVCFGDNISLGLLPDWSIAFGETYHYLWSKEVDKTISLANNSISGAGVLDLCLYARRDIFNYKPDIAIIMLGNVDAWLGKEALPAFKILYSAMLKIIKKHGVEPVVVSAIPQITKNIADQDLTPGFNRDDYQIEGFVNAAKQAALENEVVFVNAHKYLPAQENYYANACTQPNLEGQNLIKKALLDKTIY